MTDSPIQVDPISPVIGAEISGVDLSAPLPPEVFETLQLALMTHLVLFFRDQALSFEQHKAFGRHFGALHIHPAAPKGGDHPEILVVHGDATVKSRSRRPGAIRCSLACTQPTRRSPIAYSGSWVS